MSIAIWKIRYMCMRKCFFPLVCHGFGRDRVNFLPKGLSDAVFWTFDENIGDNTLMYLIVAELCLHRAQDV